MCGWKCTKLSPHQIFEYKSINPKIFFDFGMKCDTLLCKNYPHDNTKTLKTKYEHPVCVDGQDGIFMWH